MERRHTLFLVDLLSPLRVMKPHCIALRSAQVEATLNHFNSSCACDTVLVLCACRDLSAREAAQSASLGACGAGMSARHLFFVFQCAFKGLQGCFLSVFLKSSAYASLGARKKRRPLKYNTNFIYASTRVTIFSITEATSRRSGAALERQFRRARGVRGV